MKFKFGLLLCLFSAATLHAQLQRPLKDAFLETDLDARSLNILNLGGAGRQIVTTGSTGLLAAPSNFLTVNADAITAVVGSGTAKIPLISLASSDADIGQVLSWNGSSWIPTTGVSLSGTNIWTGTNTFGVIKADYINDSSDVAAISISNKDLIGSWTYNGTALPRLNSSNTWSGNSNVFNGPSVSITGTLSMSGQISNASSGTISFAGTGTTVSLASSGTGTNVNLRLATKGVGAIFLDGDVYTEDEIRMQGFTSGVITLAVPAISGTNTITIPAATGTMALLSDVSLQMAEVPIPNAADYADVAYTGFSSAPTYIGTSIQKASPSDPDIFVTTIQSVTATSARVNLSDSVPNSGYTLKIAAGSDSAMAVGVYQPLSSKLSSIVSSASNTLVISEVTGLQSALDGKGALTGTNTWTGPNSFTGDFTLSTSAVAPATATSSGIPGTIRIVGEYLYVCTGTTTWVRAQLLSW